MTATALGAPEASREELLGLYRDMLLIRRFEEKAGQLYGMGLIGGYCHLSIGQEAVAVGVEAAARPGDARACSYRSHGAMLACGIEPDRIMAELTGRIGGISRGKGGSMHMFSPDHGFYGGHGIVGAQVPIGAGLGFAAKYRKDGGVAFVTFGDAAADQGQVWEAMNMAQLWKLPCIFIIENNHDSAGAIPLRGQSRPALHKRAEALGLPARSVDGMDVLAVREAARMAAAHCRSGAGPYCLEMQTLRYRGHSMAAPDRYRSREEASQLRGKTDPIEHARALLIEHDMAGPEDLRGIDADIRALVHKAADFAQSSPAPGAAELHADIHAPRHGG